MAWGAISYYGKTPLLWIHDYLPFGEDATGLDAEGYVGMLETAVCNIKAMMPHRWWFQQDGAKIHTARVVHEWSDRELHHCIGQLDWPANSADLSPIENIWGIIDSKITKAKLTSQKELVDFVEEQWAAITLEELRSLIDSVPLRLTHVRETGGERYQS